MTAPRARQLSNNRHVLPASTSFIPLTRSGETLLVRPVNFVLNDLGCSGQAVSPGAWGQSLTHSRPCLCSPCLLIRVCSSSSYFIFFRSLFILLIFSSSISTLDHSAELSPSCQHLTTSFHLNIYLRTPRADPQPDRRWPKECTVLGTGGKTETRGLGGRNHADCCCPLLPGLWTATALSAEGTRQLWSA